MTIPEELRAHLAADDVAAAAAGSTGTGGTGTGGTGTGGALAERLARFGRRLRARPVDLGGFPALVHPASGRVFAAAFGERSLAVRTASGWDVVDAWPDDVTFRRGDDAVLHALSAAMDESRG